MEMTVGTWMCAKEKYSHQTEIRNLKITSNGTNVVLNIYNKHYVQQ